jgi:hypothetical protein
LHAEVGHAPRGSALSCSGAQNSRHQPGLSRLPSILLNSRTRCAPDPGCSCFLSPTEAEAAATENRQRAERAELREQAHQDRWAAEVDQLRQAAKAQPKYAAEIRSLQEQVLRLTVELHAARRMLSDTTGSEVLEGN